ncbi:MAG TPA: SIR2 family protein [Rhizomicrobium sp.]
MNRVLLVGAGFSRNWGGPLASEVFDGLLQQPEINGDSSLKKILWDHKDAGGFENALAQVQQDVRNNASVPGYRRRLDGFQAAIDRIFSDMDRGFAARPSWEFTNQRERMLLATLVKFDAIFSLNQDLLFERFYFNDNVMLESRQTWNGVIAPGVRETRDNSFPYDPGKSRWTPLPSSEFKVEDRFQPYFKLHGSWHWNDGTGQQLMVMGASKALTISGHPILSWYQTEFARRLRGDTRLMIIGYGFNDPHINETILTAAQGGGLKLFIIDPLGVDVANPDRNLPLQRQNPFKDVIHGASKRSLSEIFGSDAVAHITVTRFLEP